MASIPRNKWQRAADLYVSGLPMRAVAEKMNTSIDAVTYVLRKLRVPRRSFEDAQRIAFGSKKPSFSIRRKVERSAELEVMGAMLYWAEGHRTKGATGLDFANSDAAMAELFIRFLRDRYALDESRFRCFLYCYEDQDVGRLTDFWVRTLGVPRAQFTKPHVRPDPKVNVRSMPHGLIHVRYSDKKLLLDILNLIESLAHRYCVGGGVVKRTTL